MEWSLSKARSVGGEIRKENPDTDSGPKKPCAVCLIDRYDPKEHGWMD
jgi:hypothetical protein